MTQPDQTAARLEELAQGWTVALTRFGPASQWHLSVHREARGSERLVHAYSGADLARVVAAAWAGEPDGEVR